MVRDGDCHLLLDFVTKWKECMYSMGCPHVRGGLFYTTYMSVYLAHHAMFRYKVGKGGIKLETNPFPRFPANHNQNK